MRWIPQMHLPRLHHKQMSRNYIMICMYVSYYHWEYSRFLLIIYDTIIANYKNALNTVILTISVIKKSFTGYHLHFHLFLSIISFDIT